jgi:hypothetical protein
MFLAHIIWCAGWIGTLQSGLMRPLLQQSWLWPRRGWQSELYSEASSLNAIMSSITHNKKCRAMAEIASRPTDTSKCRASCISVEWTACRLTAIRRNNRALKIMFYFFPPLMSLNSFAFSSFTRDKGANCAQLFYTCDEKSEHFKQSMI